MKKFLLLLAALACVGASNAQSLSLASAAQPELPAYGLPATAPADAIKWGYYFGNSFSGLGNKAAGTFSVAMKVPGTTYLKDAQIVSVNLPVLYTGMSKVSVWGRKSLTSTTDEFSQAVSQTLKSGYNEIELAAPYTIDGDFYLGYTFTVATAATENAQYPIAIADGYNKEGLWLSLGGAFENYSDKDFGVSALQIFLTNVVNLSDRNAAFEAKSNFVSAASVENAINLVVVSTAKQPISSIEYEAKIGTEVQTGTAELNVGSGFDQKGVATIAYTAPDAIGAYNMTLAITKVNGQENSDKSSIKVSCENITRVNPRKVLVEEFTGTGCGFCPRGWVGMEGLKETRSDVCVPIAVHQYNTSDPMSIATTAYAKLPVKGAPSSVVDRKEVVDPYYGSSGDAYGIYEDVDSRIGNASIAVEVSGLYNEDKTQVEATANLEFLGDLSTYRIEFVLTADSLSGTSSAWKQQNYYVQYTPANAGVDPATEEAMASFCSGGKNGKSSVFLTFNDVAIASSYVNSKNTAETIPTDYITGESMTTSCTLTMPTKAALKNALKYDLIFVNALLFDDMGKCVNAARARVLTQEEAEGIEQITNDNVCNDGVMYNLAGQRVSKSFKGIVVKNGKKMIF